MRTGKCGVRTSKHNPGCRILTDHVWACHFFHAQVIKTNPEAKFGEIAKIIGAQWRKLTDAQKKPFLEKEKAGKEKAAAAAK